MNRPQPPELRCADLRQLADRLDAEHRMPGEPPHGWMARAILDSIEARREADLFYEPIAPVRLARLLLSGLVGQALSDEIRDHFGSTKQATRDDYILAIGIAAACWVAERTELLARLKVAAKAQRAA